MVEQSQALVVSPDDLRPPRQQPVPWQDFQGMMTFAEIAYDSGLCPKHIPNWQGALVIMQKATELAIPPIEGLMGIYMIDGKTVVSSRLMAGLVTRAFGPGALEMIVTDDTRATVRYWRPGMAEPRELSWTIEQAELAGFVGRDKDGKLSGKKNWIAFPAAMLRARAISAVCSFAFADVIGGLLTPDEIENIPVRVTIDGDVAVDSQALPRPEPPKRLAQTNGHAVDTNTGEVVAQQDPEALDAPANGVKRQQFLAVEAEIARLDPDAEQVTIPDSWTNAQAKAARRLQLKRLEAAKQRAEEIADRERQLREEAERASTVDMAQYLPSEDLDASLPF